MKTELPHHKRAHAHPTAPPPRPGIQKHKLYWSPPAAVPAAVAALGMRNTYTTAIVRSPLVLVLLGAVLGAVGGLLSVRKSPRRLVQAGRELAARGEHVHHALELVTRAVVRLVLGRVPEHRTSHAPFVVAAARHQINIAFLPVGGADRGLFLRLLPERRDNPAPGGQAALRGNVHHPFQLVRGAAHGPRSGHAERGLVGAPAHLAVAAENVDHPGLLVVRAAPRLARALYPEEGPPPAAVRDARRPVANFTGSFSARGVAFCSSGSCFRSASACCAQEVGSAAVSA